jgi:hypothetical protein
MTLDPSEPGDGGITVGGTHTAATSVGSSISAPATLTVDPNTFVQIFKTGGVEFVGIQFPAVDDSPNPTGSLGESATLVLSSTASTTNVLTTPGAGLYHDLGGDPTCELESGVHIFATHTVSVNTSGEYTFRVVTTDPLTGDVVAWGDNNLPIDDPFVAVYTAFDPADPDSNVVGCNDDGDNNESSTEYLEGTSATIGHTHLVNGNYSQFVKNLDAGTYTLVLMSRQDQSISDWNEEAYPAQSATFELWGPEGAYALSDTGAALPDTGLTTPSWVLPTGLSVVAFGLAIGAVSFLRRRRA